MPTTTNKQRVLPLIQAQARKTPENTEERGVLEQFLYGLLRQGATTDQADTAFQTMRTRFFDWNEVRVSSYREIEEAIDPLPGAEKKAHLILLFLQEVFEIYVSFDLQKLEKEGLKNAQKKLARFKASDDFVLSWMAQRCLGGHAIPLDEVTLRCVQRLGLVEESRHDLESIRGSLEHQIPKAKGIAFTEGLTMLASEYCQEQARCGDCPLSRECPSAGSVPAEPVPVNRRKPK